MAQEPVPQSRKSALTGLAVRIGLLILIVLALHRLLDWLLLRASVSDAGGMMTFGLIALMLLAYALLIAVPFVPGIEIGLSLLMLRGAEVAPWVYLATLLGLMLAFLAGQLVRLEWLEDRLRVLGLRRAASLIAGVRPLPEAERLALLRTGLPRWMGDLAVRWRYLFLAVLVNVPGNGLIGGGGGICIIAGMTGVYRPFVMALTIALAVAPVPLLTLWWGATPFSPR